TRLARHRKRRYFLYRYSWWELFTSGLVGALRACRDTTTRLGMTCCSTRMGLDRCGVGFEVPASLAPIEPKFEACPRDLQFIVGRSMLPFHSSSCLGGLSCFAIPFRGTGG